MRAYDSELGKEATPLHTTYHISNIEVHKIAELVNKACALFIPCGINRHDCVNTLEDKMNSNNVVNYKFPSTANDKRRR